MSDDALIPKPMPQSGRSKPPTKPPRIALGFDDDEDDYGRAETISLDSDLIVFEDVAITFPDSAHT